MMGLEKLLRGLYGSGPQLDMDRQFARVRVPKPMTFDFRALADGIQRNNVGTAGIELQATVEIRDGTVVIQPTGQTLKLSNSPSKGSARKRMKVADWDDPAKTSVEVLD